ncbi:NUDIX hydrolase [Microbacterium betulae]|uniref:NUDIX hydrolase n=1 Tax=Microbacterium betulae TaxID=2981139 RepID=A0AA97FI51_9MICO|nr:NUDIX hydrolase [Microbacterium sp. AB]WOF21967.1 NUDIX hydrolase [Microbacterium sp. AB]
MADAGSLRDEPSEVEVVSHDVVFEGRVWDIVSERFAYGDGELTREFMAHPGAAAIVAVDPERRVLLIQQYRHPIGERDWELPAGLLDVAGESPLEAARRELAEEADLTAGVWDELGAVHLSPGGSSELIHLFLARELSATEAAFARDAEEAGIVVEWIPLDEAVRAVVDGRFRNAITGMGVLLAAERLRGTDR